MHGINRSPHSPLWEPLISHIFCLFRTSVCQSTPCQTVESVVNSEWIYAKESDHGLILSIVTKFAAFARDNHNCRIGVVPPASHIRTKRPPDTSQKLHCLKCLAGCDLWFVFTIQVSWRWIKYYKTTDTHTVTLKFYWT
jgi:hypothetical protein